MTHSDTSVGERTLFSATLTGALPEVTAAPELSLRLPVDGDHRDALHAWWVCA